MNAGLLSTEQQQRAQQAVLSVVALIAALALPRLASNGGPFAALGPAANAILWLPGLLWLLAAALPFAAQAALDSGIADRLRASASTGLSRALRIVLRSGAILGLLARLSVLLIAVRVMVDPTGTSLPQQFVTLIGGVVLPALGSVFFYLAVAVFIIIALPFVFWVSAQFLGGPAKAVENVVQRSVGAPRPNMESLAQSASKGLVRFLGTFAAAILPELAKIGLRLLAGLGYLLVAIIFWALFGVQGLRQLSSPSQGTRSSLGDQLLGTAGQLSAAFTSGASFGGLFNRHVPGVWRDAIRIKHVQGQRTQERAWRLPNNTPPALQELNEMARAIVIAYDTLLSVRAPRPEPDSAAELLWFLADKEGRNQPRPQSSSRDPNHEILVSRAWSTPTYHALVIPVFPPAAAEKAARLSPASLIPLIDSHSAWTATELMKGLNLSDPRLRGDEHREGQTGLFITMAREGVAEEAEDPADEAGDAVVKAIRRGLREMDESPDLFKLASGPVRGYDTLSYRFTTAHWTQTEAAGSIAAREGYLAVWQGLRNAIRHIGRFPVENIGLWHDDETREFVVTIKVPAPPFPGDAPGDKRTSLPVFIAEHAPAMVAEPRRYCAGLDHEGTPVWVDFRIAPHVLVVGGTGSGKTASGVIAPVLQLASIQSPEEFGLWLLDSRKRELRAQLSGLPHVERMVIATDGQIVLDTVAAYVDLMRERQEQLNGKAWTPASGLPWYLLVIEEWQVMKSSIEAADKNAMKQIEAAINELAAIGRSVGCHVLLASQKGTADVLPPAITINLPTKVMGFSRQADYQAILGVQGDQVPLPQEHPGRLALGRGVEPVIIQGLYATEHEAEKIVRGIAARWPKPVREARDPATNAQDGQSKTNGDQDGEDAAAADGWFRSADGFAGRPAPGPFEQRETKEASLADDREADLPRDPSDEEINNLDALTAARLIYRHQASFDTWLTSSQSLIHELIAARPGRSGSIQRDKIIKALQELERVGVLIPRPGSGRGDRQLNQISWREAYQRITDETEEEAA